MAHQYKLGGYNIVLDVCSGGLHIVDDVAYDIIALFEEKIKIVKIILTGSILNKYMSHIGG